MPTQALHVSSADISIIVSLQPAGNSGFLGIYLTEEVMEVTHRHLRELREIPLRLLVVGQNAASLPDGTYQSSRHVGAPTSHLIRTRPVELRTPPHQTGVTG